MAYTVEQFLEIIKPAVIADMKQSKILASLTAAQAIIESNKGNSGLTKKANNLFGIKANKSWTGAFVTMPTKEFVNGQYITVNAKFRAYDSWAASISDHSAFLLKNKRYKNLIGVTDYKTACRLIREDGYATSPTYTKTLTDTIERYKLYEWDSVGEGIPTTYQIGRTYTLLSDMQVRQEPAGEYKPLAEFTPDGQKHGFSNDKGGALRKGTRVTVKDIQTLYTGAIWLQIPSGWVCGRGVSGNIYIS